MRQNSYAHLWGKGRLAILTLTALILGALPGKAQLNEGGLPASFTAQVLPLRNLRTVQTPDLNLQRVQSEDERDESLGLPPRFGYPQEVNIDLLQDGDMEELDNGLRIWRTRIICPGAVSINLLYDQFWLPEGGRLFIYSENREQILGAFTSQNNKGTRDELAAFASSLLYTTGVVVEYEQPVSVEEDAIISIQYAVHGYRMIRVPDEYPGRNYGSSGGCQVNVNCAEGNAFQDEKKGVAMILVGGTRWCTGSLVNNTAEDGDLLFLTADHCLTGGLDAVSNPNATNWSFVWEYESPGCGNTDPGALQTTAGATLISNATETDMALFRLTEDPRTAGYDVYFNGWDRSTSPGANGVGIHHPAGDIKKIATHSQTPLDAGWSGTPANSHWRVNWDATANGHSVTEGGSSGSPLFNANSHIIGQLHGGSSINCSNPAADPGIYGKLDLSWNGYQAIPERRLSDHLDPLGTAPNTLNGSYLNGSPPVGGCTGTVTSYPYTEDYEGAINWTQNAGDDFNWTRQSGGTSSSNTGPTGAAQGTFYAYMEVSGANHPNRTAIITSPCYDLSSVSNPEISFQYHANGATVGTLRLEASTDGSTWAQLWSLTGDQGTAWQSQTVSLNAYTNATELRLRFNGTSGSSYTGDICIDDLTVDGNSGPGSGTCAATVNSFPYNQNFDGLALCANTAFACAADGACALGSGWTNGSGDDIDWSVDDQATPSSNTGPTADHTSGNGRFLYTESSSCYNNNGDLLSPCFDLSGEGNATLSFWYHLYGATTGSLSLQVSTNEGTTWSGNVWSLTGDQGNAWQQASVDLSSYAGSTIRLRFRGTTGTSFTSDMAIDDVEISTGTGGICPAIDFNSYTIDAYGTSQDNGTFAVQDAGVTLMIQNNAWKSIDLNYNVTANTVVEFDFRSTTEGEIHGIGFDNDNSISSNLTFKVHGTQNWGINTNDNYVPSAWTTYTIPVGASYTGTYDRLFFVADKDAAPQTNNSYFRNVKIYEGSCESLGENAIGGLDELAPTKHSFQVSPNPFNDKLDIQMPTFELPGQTADVVLLDLMGKEVYHQEGITGSDVSIQPNIPAGVYILKLRVATYTEEYKVIKVN